MGVKKLIVYREWCGVDWVWSNLTLFQPITNSYYITFDEPFTVPPHIFLISLLLLNTQAT